MDCTTLAEILTQINYLYVAAVLALAFVFFLLIRRQPKHVRAYSTENGEVIVSRAAIVELVQTSCEQIKEVSKPHVRMQVKGGQTHFEVRLKLASGGQLRAIETMLQAHLRRALTDNLGIENLGRINIVATGFKSGRLDSSSSIAKKQPSAESDSEFLNDLDEPKN
jgi:hypothetical protein